MLFIPKGDHALTPSDLGRPENERKALAPCVDHDRIQKLLFAEGFASSDGQSPFHIEAGKYVCVSIHPRDRGRLEELFDVIQRGLADDDVEISMSSAAVDLTPQGQDKAWAIEQVLKAYDLTWEAALVMGDQRNDLPALERAGLAVCPGVAHADVVTACHHQFDAPHSRAALLALRLLDGVDPRDG